MTLRPTNGVKVALHVKTRLWTPKGYDELNKTWTPQVLLPTNLLHIALDPRDKSFVELKLLNQGAELMTGREWLTRFKGEYDTLESEGHTCVDCGSVTVQDLFPAAKRAAGLPEQ